MKAACVADYRNAARQKLPRVLFDYIDGGSYGEHTLAANVDDFSGLGLRQRVMKDVSKISTATRVFGRDLSTPVILAPVGLAGMFARRGEAQAARSATAAGVPFTLSTVGVCSIREVAAAAGAPPWFQLYMIKDRGFMAELLAEARAVECPVLLFTVDLPVAGARYRDTRNGLNDVTMSARVRQMFGGAAHPSWLWDVGLRGRPHSLGNVASASGELSNLQDYMAWIGRNFDPAVTWRDIDWVRERWSGPLVIKGVIDVEDALEARRCGADGVVVSNHGGRQLDGVSSSITALPAVVDAVGDAMTILMDGGVRSGLDVLKALALGAQACLLGRAWAYAVAADGGRGVARMLAIVEKELRVAMSLTGCTDVAGAGRSLLRER